MAEAESAKWDEYGMPVSWSSEKKKQIADSGIRYLKDRIAACGCFGQCPGCQERRQFIEWYKDVLRLEKP